MGRDSLFRMTRGQEQHGGASVHAGGAGSGSAEASDRKSSGVGRNPKRGHKESDLDGLGGSSEPAQPMLEEEEILAGMEGG